MKFTLCALFAVATCAARADDLSFLPQRQFSARDSLDIGKEASEDARRCLRGLVWEPAQFQVGCETSIPTRGDALVRFASPVESGDVRNDRVAMEWFVARSQAGLVMALALVHHLAIGNNVPLPQVAAFFADLAPWLIVEFISPWLVGILFTGWPDPRLW